MTFNKGNLRILFAAHNLFPYESTGVPIATYNQATELQKRGHQTAVLLPGSAQGLESTTVESLTIYKIPSLEYSQWFLEDFFQDRSAYLQLIQQAIDDFKPNLAHINNLLYISPKIMELLKERSIPIVREFHDITEYCLRQFPAIQQPDRGTKDKSIHICSGPDPNKCTECMLKERSFDCKKSKIKMESELIGKFFARFQYLQHLYSETIDAAIYPSNGWMSYCRKFIPPATREQVLPLGLSNIVLPKPNRCSLPVTEPLRIVYIGNIVPLKGIDLLCQALEKPALLQANFTLNIYGTSMDQELQNRISKLQRLSDGKIQYHGAYSPTDIPKILDQADIGIIPSYFETFCLTLRELLAHGKPVIASSAPALSDVIEDGVNGLIFPVGDSQTLGQKMLALINDRQLLQKLTEGAKETAILSAEEEAKQLETLYLQIIGSTSTKEIPRPEPQFQRKPVSVIIVTYNSMKTLAACIQSVTATTQPGDQIIIIDNASRDGTQRFLQTIQGKDPRFIILLNNENIGFSRGCNLGYQAVTNEYVVLMNPDAVATPHWLEEMQKYFTAEEIGAVGPLSNYVVPKQRVERYLPMEKLAESMELGDLARLAQTENWGRSIESKLLIGFCLMLSKWVIDQIGLLDDSLFLGNDDLELSWRLRSHGYKLLVASDVFIYHMGHVSFQTEPEPYTNYLVQHSTNLLAHKLAKEFLPEKRPNPEVLWEIDWFKPSTAVTSIIIPCYNQLKYTKLCVKSILEHTHEPYELIFIDNGSTDGTPEYLEQLANSHDQIQVIRNANNLGFGAACNQGFKAAKGQYCLLLNNDVVVTDGWLARMLAVGDSFPNVGIIGPCSNYVVGAQLVKDVPYKTLPQMHDFARERAVRLAAKGFESQRIIGLCMMVKRGVIDRIGGFDTRFRIGNFEDDDYCLRARIAGFKTWVCEDVFVHHFGNKTFTGSNLDIVAITNSNWQLFKQKWNLPPEHSWEQGYNPSPLINVKFDPKLHHCPLE